MSSSDYPTINYNVFIPSNWSSSSSGFTEAQLNKKYLKFPTAQTTQPETMNNIVLTGRITTTTANPLVIDNPSNNTFISSVSTSTATGVDNTSLGKFSLPVLTSGNRNTAIGNECLTTLTTGSDNTAVGHRALLTVATSGSNNTSVGSRAGEGLPTSSNNSFFGFQAGANVASASTAGLNTFLGALTKFNSSLGNYTKSTAIGYDATITASNQIVMGTSTETLVLPLGIIQTPNTSGNVITSSRLNYTTIGTLNTAYGAGSFQSINNAECIGNTAVGVDSLRNINATAVNEAVNNTAIGRSSGFSITTGSLNTCLGFSAGGSNITTGTRNTFIGESATSSITNPTKSTAIGSGAIVTASNQVVLGTSTENIVVPSGIITNPKLTGDGNNTFFSSRTTANNGGQFNTAIGIGAFNSNVSSNSQGNTAVGFDSLKSMVGTGTVGQSCDNTCIGKNAGFSITTGSGNTIIGSDACSSVLTTGIQNTLIGDGTSIVGSGTSQSTAIGYNAQITGNNQLVMGTSGDYMVIPSGVIQNPRTTSNNTLISSRIAGAGGFGEKNTSLGIGSLNTFTTSTTIGNTAVGFDSLKVVNSTSATTGINNTAVGNNSGVGLTTGRENTFIGNNSGGNLTTGIGNTCIGNNTSSSASGWNNSTAIGNGATITASNQVVLGTSSENVVVPSAQFIFPLRQFYGGATQINDTIALTYPLNRIYAVSPNSTPSSSVVITLPAIAGANEGTIVTFRMVNVGGTGVGTISIASGTSNIFIGTSNTPTNSHIIYTYPETILRSHTFMACSTNLGSGGGRGWFQLGTTA